MLDIDAKTHDFLKVSGDLNYIVTFTDNLEMYYEAKERFNKHLMIEDNKLIWSVDCGNDLNVSDQIFEYIQSEYIRLNESIVAGEINVELDEFNKILIIPINEDTISTRYLSSAKTVIYPGDPRSTLKALLKFINAFRYNALCLIILILAK